MATTNGTVDSHTVSTESFSVGKVDFGEILDLEILREILENDVIRENGYDWDERDFHFGIFEKAVSRERNFNFTARLTEKGGHFQDSTYPQEFTLHRESSKTVPVYQNSLPDLDLVALPATTFLFDSNLPRGRIKILENKRIRQDQRTDQNKLICLEGSKLIM